MKLFAEGNILTGVLRCKLRHNTWASSQFINEHEGHSFIAFLLLWIIPEIFASNWQRDQEIPLIREEPCITPENTACWFQPIQPLNYASASNKYS